MNPLFLDIARRALWRRQSAYARSWARLMQPMRRRRR